MIRRKMWATATCCLALAGVSQAQTSTKASLGLPQQAPSYTARGAEPNPGYPVFVPRNYTTPATPHYTMPASALPARLAPQPVAPPVQAEPQYHQFAVGAEVQATPATTPPMGTAAVPMAMPMTGDMGMPMQGDPMTNAPYLDGVGGYNVDQSLPTVWASGEFLSWRLKGVNTPILVSAAPGGSSGTLDDPSTRVIYGESDLLRDNQTGFRVRAGVWFMEGNTGLDIAFFSIGNAKERANYGSDGSNGLFRPFFNTVIGAEDAQLLAFPGVVGGGISIDTDSDLTGGELNLRQGWGMGLGGKLDMICGFRYMRLRDTIDMRTNLTTLAPIGNVPAGTLVQSQDRFEALNQFYGGQIGVASEWQIGMMSFGLRATVAAGIVDQRVTISGGSGSITPTGTTVTSPGGLYALASNIGEQSRTRFSVIPEVGATFGVQVHNNIKIFGGYNVLAWTNVARAGEQINRNVNSTFITDPLTGAVNPSGAPAPTFHHRDDNFFAHGWTAGLEFRW